MPTMQRPWKVPQTEAKEERIGYMTKEQWLDVDSLDDVSWTDFEALVTAAFDGREK